MLHYCIWYVLIIIVCLYYMQVPLGVIPKDEMKYEDMLAILDHIQQYVPAKEVDRELIDPVTEEVETLKDHHLVTTLVGGDQLTTARARGAQLIRGDCDSSKLRLAGLLPVTEDWHAKLCLMKVVINSIACPLCLY